MNYVVGFAFNRDLDTLVLIEKQNPTWQRGLLNGVGGKMESQEHSLNAMVREFQEETGVQTSTAQWFPFGSLTGPSYSVFLFVMYDDIVRQCHTTTSEQIVFVHPRNLPLNVVPNLKWLVPAALCRYTDIFTVGAKYV